MFSFSFPLFNEDDGNDGNFPENVVGFSVALYNCFKMQQGSSYSLGLLPLVYTCLYSLIVITNLPSSTVESFIYLHIFPRIGCVV